MTPAARSASTVAAIQTRSRVRESGATETGAPAAWHRRVWLRGAQPFLVDPRQLVRKVGGGLPAVVRILRQTLLQQSIERAAGDDGQSRLRVREIAQRRRIAAEDRGDDTRVARALERAPAGDHLEQHGAEREDVAARVDVAIFELLGRHVVQGAEDRALSSQRRCARVVVRQTLRPAARRVWPDRSRAASCPSS